MEISQEKAAEKSPSKVQKQIETDHQYNTAECSTSLIYGFAPCHPSPPLWTPDPLDRQMDNSYSSWVKKIKLK